MNTNEIIQMNNTIAIHVLDLLLYFCDRQLLETTIHPNYESVNVSAGPLSLIYFKIKVNI